MQYIQYFFLPLILSLVLTPLVRSLAFKFGFVSYPRTDRWHKKPTALLGGIGIYLSTLITILLSGIIKNQNAIGLIIGASFLFLVGLADDKFHLRPYAKLFCQIIAVCIAILFGITIRLPINTLLIVPFTLIWIVGITNSFNLLDNIDGLAAGIAAISSLTLFFSSILISNNPLGIFGLVLSGAALGFLPYNFNPAKIFMGDSGSMFLGYAIALISISGTGRHISNLLTTLLMPVLILSVPIFDTLYVMIVRRLQGRKIFEGGKDHTSHRLLTLGLSPRRTVFVLYGISIIFGLIVLLYSRLDFFIISVIAFLAIAILVIFGIFLSDSTPENITNKLSKQHYEKTILNNMLLHKRRFVEVFIDFGLVCIAYYMAYFLRFEGFLLKSNTYLLKQSLTWIIIIKMSVFFIFGLYRGVWKYISVSDLLTIFKVVSFASIASVLFLTFAFRFGEYSRAVFFIDWIVLLFLISASRISFRVLDEFFNRTREKGKKILIYGAGDTGEMVIREIKRNNSLNYNPVGFIDDNPSKTGSRIQGLSVLGTRDQLRKIIAENNIAEVLIAIPSLDNADFVKIAELCRACGTSYKKIKGILDEDTIDRSLAQ